MRAWFALSLLAVATPSGAKPVSARGAVIPPAYRGEYSMRSKWCGTDGDDEDERLWVRASEVSLYEASRKVDRVIVTAKGLKILYKPWAKEYYADGFDPNEGAQPPDELVLSRDGQVMNRVYRRCPVKRKR